MRKVIFMVVVIILIIGAVAVWLFSGGGSLDSREIGTLVVLALVILFASFLGYRRWRSIRRSEPAEDELSKRVLRRAAGTSYYLSLYSWLILMYLSDKVEMEISSFIGLGIMIMAVEFALSWVYHHYFSRIKE